MGKKFLAEVETDKYYHVEIKQLSKSEYISKDKIREKIKEIEKDENPSISSFQEYAQEYAINKLQELLKENKSDENNI